MSDTSSPQYNILTIMKRLEAATSRLEDLTVFQSDSLKKAGSKSVTIDPTPRHDEDVPMPDVDEVKPLSTSLKEFDDLIAEFVDPFVALSKGIDPLVEEQAVLLHKAFESERQLLEISEHAAKPQLSDKAFQDLFAPIAQQGASIGNVRESNRASKFSFHLATVAEGIPALAWVTDEKPVAYITDFKDAAQFWANKILKEFKETDKKQVEWAQSFSKLLNGLQQYVKKNHTTGLSWARDGKPLAEVLKNLPASAPSTPKVGAASSPAPPSAAGGPPPPPPPPPPPMPPASVFQVEKSEPSGMSAVFADLNKGEGVTAGLKKVDKSQMTHKNPELRKNDPVLAKRASPKPPKKPATLSKKKPARKELEDRKWIIENFDDVHDIVIDAEMDQVVFIDRCNKCTIMINGKVNTVFVNSSSSLGLMVESLVGAVEIVKTNNFKVQVTGQLPTLSVDQCDKGEVYLNEISRSAEIYTSQSTGLNICLAKGDEGDFTEQPVPEQLVHTISENGTLKSEIVVHKD